MFAWLDDLFNDNYSYLTSYPVRPFINASHPCCPHHTLDDFSKHHPTDITCLHKIGTSLFYSYGNSSKEKQADTDKDMVWLLGIKK